MSSVEVRQSGHRTDMVENRSSREAAKKQPVETVGNDCYEGWTDAARYGAAQG